VIPADRWKYFSWVLAGFLGGLFIYSGLLKIMDPAAFAGAVKNYRLLPAVFVSAAAIILPWWELAAGVAVWIPKWRRAGALVLAGLACVFLIAVISALIRGLDISCGCFGAHSHRAGLSTLAIDIASLAAAACLLIPSPARPETRGGPGTEGNTLS